MKVWYWKNGIISVWNFQRWSNIKYLEKSFWCVMSIKERYNKLFFRLVVSRGKAWSRQHFLKLWNLNQCPLLKMLMLGHKINTLIAKDVISPLGFILWRRCECFERETKCCDFFFCLLLNIKPVVVNLLIYASSGKI